MIRGPTSLRTVGYAAAPAVGATSLGGEAPDGSAPPAQPAGTPGDGAALTRTARRAGRAARRHWLLLILLAAGLGLRVVTQLAYRPALFYIDSYKYLKGSGGHDPVGYNLLLKPVLWAGNLATVAAVQHLLGLAMAVILYLTLSRRTLPAGPPPWPPLRCCWTPTSCLGYMTVSMITGNGFALASRGADVLYGRAAVAANCTTLRLPAGERSLCPAPSVAGWGIDRIVNNADGPYQSYKPSPGTTKQQAADDFALAVLRQQPLAIPLSVLRDAARLFALTRDGAANITQISRWQFQPVYPTFPPGVTRLFVASEARTYGGGAPVAVRPLASFLRAYQLDGGYTPGPLLAAMTGAGAIGSLFVFARRATRRRGSEAGRPRGRPADRQLAAAAIFTTLAAVTVVLGSDIYEFSWRYQLPAPVTLPLAGVFGAMVIARSFRLRPGRRPATGRP